MIPDGSDKSGHSVRMLLQFAIDRFPEKTVFDFVTDKDRIVAAMAARRLQADRKLRAERAFHFTVELARHKNAWHRELAAFILGQLRTPDYPFKAESIPILESLARDPDAEVRGEAIISLGRLESGSSKQLILEALNDPDPGVVECVAFALSCVGRSEADMQRLRKAVRRFDEKTQKTIDLWED